MSKSNYNANIRMSANQQIYANKTAPKTGEQVLYPELSFEITGLCFAVQNELGPFAREKQYGDLLEKKLGEKQISYRREARIPEPGNIVDFIADNKIAVELKAKRALLPEDFRQVQNYLQASGLKLGLLFNFRGQYVRSERILRLEPKSAKEWRKV